MMTRHEEIYSRFINGETDMNKLGKEYGVTRERIRQVIEKQEHKVHPLRVPIAAISNTRSSLERAAKELIGNVDNDTLCKYNDLIKQFDSMIDRLKDIDEGNTKFKGED